MIRAALIVSTVLMLATLGCARERASLAPEPMAPPGPNPFDPGPAPAPAPASEPTRASLNQKKIPADLNTVRASYEAATPPAGAESAPAPAVEGPDPQGTKPPAPAPKPAAPAGDGAMTIRADPDIAPGKPVARAAAVVGDTIITHRELKVALFERAKIPPQEFAQLPDAQKYEMLKDTLNTLIDRTLIIREGRRTLFKKPEQWTKFSDYVDKTWRDKELPPLLKKEGVGDERALARKLESRGESLDDVKETWKLEAMSRELLMIRIQKEVERPGLPELEKYYAAHRKEPGYHRDARVHWREVVVGVEKPEALPAARAKAQALRNRLLAGEDFAQVARTSSSGVTAAKGGAWETAPDGTATPALNAALAKLPLGQISPPIEGPSGIHIVRVERRTVAGTAPFVEVQREIADKLFQERFSAAIEAYLKGLRKQAVVTSPLFREISNTPAVAEDAPKTDDEAKRASMR